MRPCVLVVLAAGLAGAAGCSGASSPRDGGGDAGGDAEARREKWKKEFRSRMEELDEQVAGLREKAGRAQGDRALGELTKQRDEARRQFEALRDSHNGQWDELSRRTDKAADLRAAVNRARLEFNVPAPKAPGGRPADSK